MSYLHTVAIELPEYYFENGLGRLDQSAAAAYQNLGS
jgi:hypothetical protein